jgi:glucosamine 6-phosphate synthetase-like amidotransferase/phosphosugar isomerase protein
MCQIQFIKRKGECLTQRDIAEFFKLMEIGSVDNSCAFGFFNNHIFYKNKGRFNLGSFNKNILKSNFIVGHNRLATTGDKNKNFNNHPFRINDFVMVHNGVVSNHKELRKGFNIKSEVETDSYVIIWLINHFFEKSKVKNRQEKICNAIRKTAKKLIGQFSVMLYDSLNNDLYYFKNSITSFGFCILDNKVLIGSSNVNNLEHIYLNEKYIFDTDLFKEKVFKKINDNTIYLINDEFFLKELEKFECDDFYLWDSSFCYNSWEDLSGETALEEQINSAFEKCLGYIPEFKFIESSGMVKIKNESKVYQDLSYFIENIFFEDDCIYFDVNDLLFHLEIF